MEMVLEDIKCMPGVSCVFCFDTRSGIVGRIAASEFSNETLSAVGRTLAKIFSGGKQVFADLQSVQLSLDRWNILIIWVVETYYLTIIHEQSLNPNLLSMTLVQTKKDLTALLAGPGAGPTPAAVEGSENRSEKIRQALLNGPYPRILAAVENSLARVMGPMASIVFQETLEKWTQSIDGLNRSTLDNLVKMLSSEIGDPDKAQAFEQQIAPLLGIR
jgi:hypothetical protein